MFTDSLLILLKNCLCFSLTKFTWTVNLQKMFSILTSKFLRNSMLKYKFFTLHWIFHNLIKKLLNHKEFKKWNHKSTQNIFSHSIDTKERKILTWQSKHSVNYWKIILKKQEILSWWSQVDMIQKSLKINNI